MRLSRAQQCISPATDDRCTADALTDETYRSSASQTNPD